MTISPDLLLAILSMDAYNRGYDAGFKDDGGSDIDGLGESGRIGNATIEINSGAIRDAQGNRLDIPVGFYAIAYTLSGGETVIAYRGTNDAVDHTEGWSVGAGMIGWNLP